MSDDMWRRGSGGGADDDEFDDFGELRFSDEETDDEAPLTFGSDDTGPLPHWTASPTGEMPRLFPDERSGGTSRPTARDPRDEDIDIWGSYSGSAPRPVPDDPSGPAPRSAEPSGGRPRVRLGESTGGTRRDPSAGTRRDPSAGEPRRSDDATTGAATRPTSRETDSGRGFDDTQGRGARPRPAGRPEPRPARTPRPTAGVGGRDMPTAVAVGLLMLAAFVAALLWKPVAVLAIVVLVCGLAAVEFFEKATEKGYRPASVLGIVACIAAPLAAYWVGDGALPLVFAFAFMAAAITYVGAESAQALPLANVAITTLGVIWIGLLGSYGALLAGASNAPGLSHVGTDTLFIVAAGVIANDVGALFVGSAAGHTPLRQWISPNKTVEGLLGGSLATLVVMWVVSLQSDTWNDIGEVLLLAIVVAALAPLGDLVESMFKRNLGIKDFGTVVRGHGGVLDRFDGFLFVLPAAYYLLMVLQPYAS
ncbi:MAG: phosphatidate cytidylyltransferase [Actinomycetota bacterium]